jgi:hypothetical protein
MRFKIILIITFIALSLSTEQLYAQFDDVGGRRGIRIPTDPTIFLNYGLSDLSLKESEIPFGDPGIFELKLGFTNAEFYRGESGIIDFMGRYVSVSYISTDLGEGEVMSTNGSKHWRVALEAEGGYGYSFSSYSFSPSILLSHTSGLAWSDISMIILPDGHPEEIYHAGRFEDAIRFGSVTEAGLKIQVHRMIALNAAYERSQIYERHLFWKGLGSVLIEGASQGLVDVFVKRIFESSPPAGPLVNFILKNGLAYGIYELRKSDMNWPFTTAAPLHYDTFKIGMVFIF